MRTVEVVVVFAVTVVVAVLITVVVAVVLAAILAIVLFIEPKTSRQHLIPERSAVLQRTCRPHLPVSCSAGKGLMIIMSQRAKLTDPQRLPIARLLCNVAQLSDLVRHQRHAV